MADIDIKTLLPLADYWIPGLGTGLSILFGANQSSDLRDQAALAMEIGAANASDLIAVTEANRVISKASAEYNAGVIRKVGYANAQAKDDTANRNFALMGLQTAYGDYQAELQTRQLAGEIRARQGSSGISVNQGSNLHYLNQQVSEAKFDRQFKRGVEKLSAFGYLQDQRDQANLIRLDTDQRAEMTVVNEALNSQIAWNEAVARARSMERGAEMNASTLRTQANSAMYNSLINAAGWWS